MTVVIFDTWTLKSFFLLTTLLSPSIKLEINPKFFASCYATTWNYDVKFYMSE